MGRCSVCGESSLTGSCNYCGKTVCSDHVLPERHNCAAQRTTKTLGPEFRGKGTDGVIAKVTGVLGIDEDEDDVGKCKRCGAQVDASRGELCIECDDGETEIEEDGSSITSSKTVASEKRKDGTPYCNDCGAAMSYSGSSCRNCKNERRRKTIEAQNIVDRDTTADSKNESTGPKHRRIDVDKIKRTPGSYSGGDDSPDLAPDGSLKRDSGSGPGVTEPNKGIVRRALVITQRWLWRTRGVIALAAIAILLGLMSGFLELSAILEHTVTRQIDRRLQDIGYSIHRLLTR